MPRRKACLDALTPIPRTEKPAEAPKPFEWYDPSSLVTVCDADKPLVRLSTGMAGILLTPDEAYRIGNALITCARLARKANASS